MAFTTKDRDNDKQKSYNCAVNQKGAWWYKTCVSGSHLNGNYGESNYYWNWSLRGSEMKLKPKSP